MVSIATPTTMMIPVPPRLTLLGSDVMSIGRRYGITAIKVRAVAPRTVIRFRTFLS